MKQHVLFQVVELKFFPDDPIETFQGVRWGLWTLGQSHHARVRQLGPHGPFTVDDNGSEDAAAAQSFMPDVGLLFAANPAHVHRLDWEVV